jgi:hypothetical protein
MVAILVLVTHDYIIPNFSILQMIKDSYKLKGLASI